VQELYDLQGWVMINEGYTSKGYIWIQHFMDWYRSRDTPKLSKPNEMTINLKSHRENVSQFHNGSLHGQKHGLPSAGFGLKKISDSFCKENLGRVVQNNRGIKSILALRQLNVTEGDNTKINLTPS
jgi:hypothetical protein